MHITLKKIISVLLILTFIFTLIIPTDTVATITSQSILSSVSENERIISYNGDFIRYDEQPLLRAATGPPKMDAKGNIIMSFISKKATSSIIYRTVGWMAHKDQYPDKNPPSNKRADFIGSSFVQVDETDLGNGYVETFFKIPYTDILSKFGKEQNLLDIKEGESFYLSSIFEVRKGTNGTQKVSGPHYSYRDIVNAAGWGSQTKQDIASYYNNYVQFKSPSVKACEISSSDVTCGNTTATGYPVILETRVNGKKVSAVVVDGGIAGESKTVNIPKTYSKDGITGELNSTHWEYEQRKGTPQDKITAPSSGLTPRTVTVKVGGTRVIADYKVTPTVKVQHWNAIENQLIEETVHQVTSSDNSFSASKMDNPPAGLSYIYSEISPDGGKSWNQRHTNPTRNIIAAPGETIIRFYYGKSNAVVADLVLTATPDEIIKGEDTKVKFTLDASGSWGKYPITKYEFFLAENKSDLDDNSLGSGTSSKKTTNETVSSSGTWYGKVIVTDSMGNKAEIIKEVKIDEVSKPEPLQIPRVKAGISASFERGTWNDAVTGWPLADITQYINRIEILDSSSRVKEILVPTSDGFKQTFASEENEDIVTINKDFTKSSDSAYWDAGRDYINVYLNYPDKFYPLNPNYQPEDTFFDGSEEWDMAGDVVIDGSSSTSTNGVGKFEIWGKSFAFGERTLDTNPAQFEIGKGGSIHEGYADIKNLFNPNGSGDIGLTYEYTVTAWDSSWDSVKDQVLSGNYIGTFPASTSACPGGDLDPNTKGCQVVAEEAYYKGVKRLTVTILRDPYAIPSKTPPSVSLNINHNEFIIGETAEFKPTFSEIADKTYPITSKEWKIYSEDGNFSLEGTGEIIPSYVLSVDKGTYFAEQTIWWKDDDENDVSKTAQVKFEVLEVIQPNVTLTLNGFTGFPIDKPDNLQKYVLPQDIGKFNLSFYEDTRRTFPIEGKGFKVWNEETGEIILQNTIKKSDYPDIDVNNPNEDNPTELPPGWGDLSSGELKSVYTLPFDTDGGIYRASQTIYWIENGKECSKTVEVRFKLISPVPVAKFNVHQKMTTAGAWKEVILGTFAGKQYKEIKVDLSPSTEYNLALENPYPILYNDSRTQIKVIPLDDNMNPDTSKNNKVVTFVAGDRVIESNEVTIKGKQQISIRFDEPGKYKIKTRVTNQYYTSRWAEKDIEISEDLPPLVSLSFEGVQTDNPISKYTTTRKSNLHVQFKINATVTMRDEDAPNYDSAQLEIKYDFNANNNPLDDGAHSNMLVTNLVNSVQPYVKTITKTGMKAFEIDLFDDARPVLGPIQFEYSIGKIPVIPYFEGGDLPQINYPRGTTYTQNAQDKTVFVDNIPGLPTVHIGKEGTIELTIYIPNSTVLEALMNPISVVGFDLKELVVKYKDTGKVYLVDKNNTKKLLTSADFS